MVQGSREYVLLKELNHQHFVKFACKTFNRKVSGMVHDVIIGGREKVWVLWEWNGKGNGSDGGVRWEGEGRGRWGWRWVEGGRGTKRVKLRFTDAQNPC